MPSWLLLITNLPGRNQTLRMRLWRALKSAGAASLRDGVYLLPASVSARRDFEVQAGEIRSARGTAYIVPLDAESPQQHTVFQALFDRTADYAAYIVELAAFQRRLQKLEEPAARRRLETLRRGIAQIMGGDFFPGASCQQAQSALADTEAMLAAKFSANEPSAVHRKILRQNRRDYQSRTWATREHLWIDRVCSAWLIRRFIDPKAKFLWLKRLKDCPKAAVGFDFDGAEFSHVDAKVTFEVLIDSFSLEHDPGLTRLAALVHYLDVGGVPIPEAAGLCAIVTGARALQRDDDALLRAIAPVLDSLYASYSMPEDI
jgi:hypothetical protein